MSQAFKRERTITYEILASSVDTMLYPGSKEVSSTIVVLGAGIVTGVKFSGGVVGQVTTCRIHDLTNVTGKLDNHEFRVTATGVSSDGANDTDCRSAFTAGNPPAPFANTGSWTDNSEEAVINLRASMTSDWNGSAHCLNGIAIALELGTVPAGGGAVTITLEPRTTGAARLRTQQKQQSSLPVFI